ncbi:zinc ribbon domain-containing protein [Tissierellaceae bacterium HCP3S3_D8]
MDQLDLIWKLEAHSQRLDKYKKELNIVNQKLKISSIKGRIEEFKSRVAKIEIDLDERKREIKEKEKRLKEYMYKSKEIDLDLYKGHISDIKQLEYLSQEKDSIVGLMDEVELEILSLMDEVDDLESLYRGDNHKLDIYRCELEDNEVEYKERFTEIEDQISEEQDIIDKIEADIDTDILKLYREIKKRRGRGIVAINNDICNGCNMSIPKYLMDMLKNGKEIIRCENCGSILYYTED